MLAPSDRTVLIETLRPPDGFRVDRVIGTTYSLDLVTLLTLPLSFTLLAGDGLNESGRADPVALLDTLRRHAGRIHIFCEAGRIAVPSRRQPLFGYLEGSVFEAAAPNGGSFHPKLTVVRYVPDPAAPAWADQPPAEQAARYKVLCGTRNLTFDSSWDTLLVLEGDLATHRVRAYGRNRPLAEFVKALPELTVCPMPDEVRDAIVGMADELLRVRFEAPPGFGQADEDLTFWPIGLTPAEKWPFDGRKDLMVVIAPFLDDRFLKRLSAETVLHAVVSRPESLAQLPLPLLEEEPQWFTLSDGVESEADAEAGTPADEAEDGGGHEQGAAVVSAVGRLQGLHAKLFVADDGWDARVWTGSANATERAFARNVEFMVELRGRRKDIGVRALMEPGANESSGVPAHFRSLLIPYNPGEETAPPDSIQRALERQVDHFCCELFKTRPVAVVSPTGAVETGPFDVALRATSAAENGVPENIACRIRPITLPSEQAARLVALSETIVRFSSLAFLSLTAFYAVSVTASADDQKFTREFVMRVPLEGAPADRENRLLLAILSNREQLLRYLMLLLGNADDPVTWLQRPSEGAAEAGAATPSGFELPLLESILRAYADDPARLKPIGQLIQDLDATEAGRSIMPEGLRELWVAIRAAEGGTREPIR